MPGRIMMDQPATRPVDLKKDKSHAQEGGHGRQNAGARSYGSQDAPMGDESHVSCVPATNGAVPLTNGDHAAVLSEATNMTNPPQLDQSWRMTDANKSMGKLMDRVAQRCYLDLQATLAEMRNLSAPVGVPAQANGILPGAVQLDDSEVSRSKKRKLLEFASDQRDRFTKTLVLAVWAQNADDMAKTIDINVWQRKQDLGSRAAAFEIADIKHSLSHFKTPAPNIEGAMELLSTGKAGWVPDPGYIAPERLTAKQLLKTLQDMNVVLATRLNLDEDLPPYMNDFTIANGRATFRVPGEFEVDLTIADEDPSTPFYFIDIRFLFTPSSDILSEIVRPRLEASVNIELASKGLEGCYTFLHNFVLTHKINVLRSQASNMIRGGKWFDCIKAELLRRTLTVSYWNGVPGQKSWLVVGVASGRRSKASWRKPQPVLQMQWFCEGVDQDDQEAADLDLLDLDLERCIISVIAKHSLRKLETAKAGIDALSASTSGLRAELLTRPSGDSQGAALKLSLLGMQKPLIVHIEVVTGQFSISPVTATTLYWQSRLNHIQNVDVPQELASMAAKEMQVSVDDQARLCGWTRLRASLENVTLPSGTYHRSHFRLEGWSTDWALTAAFGIAGGQWFLCRVQDRPATAPDTQSNNVLVSLWELDSKEALAQPETLEAWLERIERLAVAEIFHRVIASEFQLGHIPYHLAERKAQAGHCSLELGPSATVFTTFSRLMGLATNAASKPWALEIVRLSFFGIDLKSKAGDGAASVKFVLKLTLDQGTLPDLRHYLGKSGDQDIRVNSTGGLAMRFWTAFGAPLVEHIRTRLKNLEKLDRYMAVVKQCGFTYKQASLNSMLISYGAENGYGAALQFGEDGSLPVQLQLQPCGNPHQRIRILLERALNNKAPSAFASFVASLQLTLPLLQTIAYIEESHAGPKSFGVNARAPTAFAITYRAPLPACKFELVARSKTINGKAEVRWLLQEAKNQPLALGEGFAKALQEFWKTADSRWKALGNSLVAPADAIGFALEKLDEVVRQAEPPKAPEQLQQSHGAPAAPTTGSGQPSANARPGGGSRPAQSHRSQHTNEIIELD